MNYRLKVIPAAALQVEEQAQYYLDESGPALAARWKAQAKHAARSLRALPERGPLCNYLEPELVQIRRLAIHGFPKHFVFYRCDNSARIVLIVAVLHGARDLERHLLLLSSHERMER